MVVNKVITPKTRTLPILDKISGPAPNRTDYASVADRAYDRAEGFLQFALQTPIKQLQYQGEDPATKQREFSKQNLDTTLRENFPASKKRCATTCATPVATEAAQPEAKRQRRLPEANPNPSEYHLISECTSLRCSCCVVVLFLFHLLFQHRSLRYQLYRSYASRSSD